MIRKIIGNLFVALLLHVLAGVRWWPTIYNAILYKKYEYYDFHIETLGDLLYEIYARDFLFDYILALAFLLLPFQLIKDYLYKKEEKGIALWKKCLILFGIISVVFAFLFRPPMTEMQERIELFASLLAISTCVTLILYFCVDSYVERPRDKEN